MESHSDTSDSGAERAFRREWRSLVAFASAVTGDPILGEELAQIAITERLRVSEPVLNDGAWLRTVVVRRARNHWRGRAREHVVLGRLAVGMRGRDPGDAESGDADPGGADPGGADPGGADPGGADPGGADPGTSTDEVFGGTSAGVLARAVEALSPMQRASVLLVYGEDRSSNEAAAILGCSPATLRVHLHRARNNLRSEMETHRRQDGEGDR